MGSRDDVDHCYECGALLPVECGLTCHECNRENDIKAVEEYIAEYSLALADKYGVLAPDEYLEMQTELTEQYKLLNELKGMRNQ